MAKYVEAVFGALADPTRRGVVERLSQGPASVSELFSPFRMSLPAFVQHLKVLERSGLLRSEKTGRVRTCYLRSEPLEEIESWLFERRTFWEARLDALAEHAERLHQEEVD